MDSISAPAPNLLDGRGGSDDDGYVAQICLRTVLAAKWLVLISKNVFQMSSRAEEMK